MDKLLPPFGHSGYYRKRVSDQLDVSRKYV